MILLSEHPAFPPEHEMVRLQTQFQTTFKRHIFIETVDLLNSPMSALPPYLQLAIASLSAATSPSEDASLYAMGTEMSEANISSDLFVAGVNLWSVMLEVDNREARLVEAVIAASFLATYGQMSVGWYNWRKASTILCNAVTISRRLHLTDECSALFSSSELSNKDMCMRSALVSYMFLIDTLQATHCGLAANFSTRELFIKMPGSSHQFRTVYRCLLHGDQIPQDARNREDALLLLTALLSDIVYAQRSLQLMSFTGNEPSDHTGPKPRSPFTPLSASSEFSRLVEAMTAGLDRWERLFSPHVSNDILALHSFCSLQLVCPDTWKLPQMAGYGETTHPNSQPSHPSEPFQVVDKAAALAWQVLECSSKVPPESRLSVWLPVIVFLSALVVWQRLRTEPVSASHYGTMRVLELFRKEIAGYHWPCSIEMTRTLNGLMES
jgi:hypothetical protein